MREIGLILLLIVLGLGGCAVTVSQLQPTLDSAAHTWLEAETRTDPVDDLVRFRQAERKGRAGSILLPVFVLLSLALLLLLLTTPLPRILKELRLLLRVRHKSRRAGPSQAWLEQPPSYGQSQHPLSGQPPNSGTLPPGSYPPAASLSGNNATSAYPSPLPPPQVSPWLEDE